MSQTAWQYKALAFFLASAYALVLGSFPLGIFKDRLNYLAYFDTAWVVMSYNWGQGVLGFISNEPLWLFINGLLGSGFDKEVALRIIIAVPAFFVAFEVLRSRPQSFFWLVLFLLLPQVIKNHIIHLRQGLAISVFLLAWFSHGRYLKYLLIALTPLIHSSFFFVLAILLLTSACLYLRLGAAIRTLLYAGVGLGFGVGLVLIGTLLDARQIGESVNSSLEVSGLGFIFWFLILVMFNLQGRHFLREHSFAVGVLVFYLSTYFLTVFSGRIFESCLIVVLLAGLDMKRWWRLGFSVMVVLYGVFGYLINASLPWFGFAADIS